MRGIAARFLGLILLRRLVEQKLINVGRLRTLWCKLMRRLRCTIRELLCHQFGVFLNIIPIITTISIAESGVIWVATNVEFIAGCDALRVAVNLAVGVR